VFLLPAPKKPEQVVDQLLYLACWIEAGSNGNGS
jgi:hypothetical protein